MAGKVQLPPARSEAGASLSVMSTSEDHNSQSGEDLDEIVRRYGRLKMQSVAHLCEKNSGLELRLPTPMAKNYFVARLMTDAILNSDVRSLLTVIERIEGRYVSDFVKDDYNREFAQCLVELLDYSEADRCKLLPGDTVLMAIAKALFDIATRDIYEEARLRGNDSPSIATKMEHDIAVKAVLNRAQGLRSPLKLTQAKQEVKEAEWITMAQLGKAAVD